MKKKFSKKTTIGIFIGVAVVAVGITCFNVFVSTGSGIEMVNGFKDSCTAVFNVTKSGDAQLLDGIKKGEKKYIGARVMLDNVSVYRQINHTSFVASSSGVGIYGRAGEKIYKDKNAKEDYLIDMDKTGIDRFVIEGSAFKMHGLTEPGPYEESQIYDVYGIYEGTKTIKDTNGTKTTLPLIKTIVLVGDQ
jgi:hypothetical protein